MCFFIRRYIFCDDSVIDLPFSWSRRNITSPVHTQVIQFSQCACRKVGKNMKTTCLEEIVIGKSLIVDLYVMGHSMELEKFNLPAEPLSCAGDLAKIVKISDELIVCSGCVFPSDNPDIQRRNLLTKITQVRCRIKIALCSWRGPERVYIAYEDVVHCKENGGS